MTLPYLEGYSRNAKVWNEGPVDSAAVPTYERVYGPPTPLDGVFELGRSRISALEFRVALFETAADALRQLGDWKSHYMSIEFDTPLDNPTASGQYLTSTFPTRKLGANAVGVRVIYRPAIPLSGLAPGEDAEVLIIVLARGRAFATLHATAPRGQMSQGDVQLVAECLAWRMTWPSPRKPERRFGISPEFEC